MRNLIPERIIQDLKENKHSDEFDCFSLFVDISGFTSTTEALMKHGQEGAEVLSDILRYLFDTTVKAVYEHGGYVTKYAGDAFTAIFQPGKNHRQTALNVLNTALITNRFFAENKIFTSKFGDFEFGVKVGIGFGHCQCGIVGPDNEKSYYFSGSAVDLCAKAEHNAVKGDVWMSESVFRYLSDVLDSPEKNEMYGLNFYKVTRTRKFHPRTAPYKPGVFKKELIHVLAGKQESEFPVGEFRDVISVFISFEGEVDLNNLMKYLYELKETYGSSHPVIDFGDKGGNILLFFGAPVSYENNSFRALSLILKLVEYAGDNFNIRAGLAKGGVYCGFNGSELRNEFTCLGNTVNQSARFMMKAGWGEILTDIELTGDKNFEFTDIGGINYKGRDGLISTFRLEKKLELKDIFFKGDFIGRTSETERLIKIAGHLFNGRNSGAVYLDGEAGIGKSRLTNQVRRILTSGSYRKSMPLEWLYFVCDDVIRAPYNPVKYFFDRYFDFTEDDHEGNIKKFSEKYPSGLKEYFDHTAYFLELGSNNAEIMSQDPVERQNSVILALVAFFRNINENKPVVYEIDNAAFADEPTIEFFIRLSTELRKSSSLFILNCRYKDNNEKYDFGFFKQKRIKLKPLGRADFYDLLKSRLNTVTLPKATIATIEKKSLRNPYFAEQIVRFLNDNSMLDSKFRIASHGEIPAGMNQIVIARIDKLEPELKEIVKKASVLGNEVHTDVLKVILGMDVKEIGRNLKELESEDILIRFTEKSYLFKYSSLREAVYGMQLKKVLRKTHNDAGLIIEKMHTDGAEKYYSLLAFHFDSADNYDKAMSYHKKAGSHLKEAYQNKASYDHYNRWDELFRQKYGIVTDFEQDFNAVKISPEVISEYIHVSIDRSYFSLSVFQNMEVTEKIVNSILFLSDSIGDEKLKALCMIEKGMFLSNKGEYDESNRFFQTASDIMDKFDMPYKNAICCLAIGKNLFTVGKFDDADKMYEDSYQYAQKIKTYYEREKLFSRIYQNRGIIYDYAGDFDKALDYYNRQLDIARKLNLKIEKSAVLGNIGVVYHLTGNLEKAREYYEKKTALTKELGNRQELALSLNNTGFLYKDLGQYKKAVASLKKSYSISREIQDFNTMAGASINLGHAYKIMKDFEKAEKEFKKGIEIAENYSFKHLIAEGMVEIGELYLEREMDDLSKTYISKGLEISLQIGFSDYTEKGKKLLEILEKRQ